MLRSITFLILFTSFLLSCVSQPNTTPSAVLDYENILNEEQENELNEIIAAFEKNTTNEVVIITTNNLGNHKEIVLYAVEMGNKLGVGKKEKDNGLVIVVSRNLRQTFLATGNGAEKILTDEICQQIVDLTMIPEFKKGNFFAGIKGGLIKCIEVWK